MKVRQLSNREQLLLALVVSALVLGGYGLFRFASKLDLLSRIESQAQATEKKLLKTRLPDQPVEDLDKLAKEIEDIEHAITIQQQEVELVTSSLAAYDSQELKVLISKLARENGIQIRVNESLKAMLSNPRSTSQNSKNKKKAQQVIAEQDLVLPATFSWIERMSPRTMFYRPLQRLEIEGDFTSIQSFIYGLEALPWTVGVLRIKLQTQPALPPYGYAQPLLAELVLSL